MVTSFLGICKSCVRNRRDVILIREKKQSVLQNSAARRLSSAKVHFFPLLILTDRKRRTRFEWRDGFAFVPVPF
jgi:hypothetical protein